MFCSIFFLKFWSIKPWTGLDPDPNSDTLEMLDPNPYPDPDSMNRDPELWFFL
jgi:hypothetical protein